jgi:hypothetical protein
VREKILYSIRITIREFVNKFWEEHLNLRETKAAGGWNKKQNGDEI